MRRAEARKCLKSKIQRSLNTPSHHICKPKLTTHFWQIFYGLPDDVTSSSHSVKISGEQRAGPRAARGSGLVAPLPLALRNGCRQHPAMTHTPKILNTSSGRGG